MADTLTLDEADAKVSGGAQKSPPTLSIEDADKAAEQTPPTPQRSLVLQPPPGFASWDEYDKSSREYTAGLKSDEFLKALTAPGTGVSSRIGKVLKSAGTDIGDVVKAYAFEAIGEPELQMEQLKGKDPWEAGRQSLPAIPRAASGAVSGLVESAPQFALAAADPVLGAMSFGFTPEGFDPVQAGTMLIAPEGGKFLGNLTSKLAAKAGISSKAALSVIDRAGGASGVAGLMSAPIVYQISKMPDGNEKSEAIENAAANALLVGVMGATGKRNEKTPEVQNARDQIQTPGGIPAVERQSVVQKTEGQIEAGTSPGNGEGTPRVAGRPGEAPRPAGNEVGQQIADDIGARFDGDINGTWNFTALDKNGKEHTSFIIKSGSSKEDVLKKYNQIRDAFAEEPDNQPRPAKTKSEPISNKSVVKLEDHPELQPGERLVKIVNPDGSTQIASYADKSIDYGEFGGVKVHVGTETPGTGKWGHGFMPEGAKIEELPAGQNGAKVDPNWRVAVKAPEGDVPGFVQIVDPKGTEAGGSKTPEQLRQLGYNVPDFSKLPQGRYTFEEAQRMAKPNPAEPPAEEPEIESVIPLEPQSGSPIVPRGTAKPVPDESLVGMGAAKYGEVQGGEGGEKFGIAQRVREERAAAGTTVPVEPGKGTSAEGSVQRGRELLAKGANPENVLSGFEETKRFSADDVSVVRAHGERLRREAARVEEKFGTDSDEYRMAFHRLADWDVRTKPIQTEWSEAGRAQQGSTDIDTGTFTGLQRAFREKEGKDFNPDQTKKAKKVAKGVADAEGEADVARTKLYQHLDENLGDPNKRALDAANKTVREAATRMAAAETKTRVAQAELDKQVSQIQTARDAARKPDVNAAIKAAKGETAARIRSAQRKLDLEKIDRDRTREALQTAQKTVRDAAAKAAEKETDERVLKADKPRFVWQKAKENYIDKGVTNFADITNGLATDLGMTINEVREALSAPKGAKALTDEMWLKQQKYRHVDQAAKRWLYEANLPGYRKAIEAVPKVLFSLKVGFHGTVALGTHAPMVAFQPPFWKLYVENFAKMYRMVNPFGTGGVKYYEMQMSDLVRRPNYTVARRAGLVNDPYQYEDFNSPDTSKYIASVTKMGNRGYSVLKVIRQDMFDQHWNDLPQTSKTPEMAAALADGINHSTGVVQAGAPRGTNLILFAPRLAASRVAWLVGDPIKSVHTFANWKNATQAERMFAINQVKEKAWVTGTLAGLLALNQGFLSATGSKQKINFTNPMKSDFMKFKAAGMELAYGNAMLSMARLPVRLYQIRESDGGKLKNLVYPDEDTYSVLGSYGRSQLSPFASLATTLWLKGDWENRPLPNSSRQVPKRLRAQGVKPYTWTEFFAEQFLPIPAEEAAREVWSKGLGTSPEQIKELRKAMATIAVMSATGARLTDDRNMATGEVVPQPNQPTNVMAE